MDVYLRLSELLVDYVLIFQVVFFLIALVLISNWHQMTLNNSSNFIVIVWVFSYLGGGDWIVGFPRRNKYHFRWDGLTIQLILVGDNYLTVIGSIMKGIFVWWSASVTMSWVAVFSVRSAIRTSYSHWRISIGVVSYAVYFKITEEKYVFIILLQNYFKHERI